MQETEKEVEEFVKTLKCIEDFTKVKEGTKIFHRYSLNINCISTFKQYIEDDNIIIYTNCKGELIRTHRTGRWYYYKEPPKGEV
jgi:hypothetical protein